MISMRLPSARRRSSLAREARSPRLEGCRDARRRRPCFAMAEYRSCRFQVGPVTRRVPINVTGWVKDAGRRQVRVATACLTRADAPCAGVGVRQNADTSGCAVGAGGQRSNAPV